MAAGIWRYQRNVLQGIKLLYEGRFFDQNTFFNEKTKCKTHAFESEHCIDEKEKALSFYMSTRMCEFDEC